MQFLMIIDFETDIPMDNLIPIPEYTLWDNFASALTAAFEAAAESGAVIDMTLASIDIGAGEMLLPGFCEIMPISVSTPDNITWLGRARTKKEKENE